MSSGPAIWNIVPLKPIDTVEQGVKQLYTFGGDDRQLPDLQAGFRQTSSDKIQGAPPSYLYQISAQRWQQVDRKDPLKYTYLQADEQYNEGKVQILGLPTAMRAQRSQQDGFPLAQQPNEEPIMYMNHNAPWNINYPQGPAPPYPFPQGPAPAYPHGPAQANHQQPINGNPPAAGGGAGVILPPDQAMQYVAQQPLELPLARPDVLVDGGHVPEVAQKVPDDRLNPINIIQPDVNVDVGHILNNPVNPIIDDGFHEEQVPEQRLNPINIVQGVAIPNFSEIRKLENQDQHHGAIIINSDGPEVRLDNLNPVNMERIQDNLKQGKCIYLSNGILIPANSSVEQIAIALDGVYAADFANNLQPFRELIATRIQSRVREFGSCSALQTESILRDTQFEHDQYLLTQRDLRGRTYRIMAKSNRECTDMYNDYVAKLDSNEYVDVDTLRRLGTNIIERQTALLITAGDLLSESKSNYNQDRDKAFSYMKQNDLVPMLDGSAEYLSGDPATAKERLGALLSAIHNQLKVTLDEKLTQKRQRISDLQGQQYQNEVQESTGLNENVQTEFEQERIYTRGTDDFMFTVEPEMDQFAGLTRDPEGGDSSFANFQDVMNSDYMIDAREAQDQQRRDAEIYQLYEEKRQEQYRDIQTNFDSNREQYYHPNQSFSQGGEQYHPTQSFSQGGGDFQDSQFFSNDKDYHNPINSIQPQGSVEAQPEPNVRTSRRTPSKTSRSIVDVDYNFNPNIEKVYTPANEKTPQTITYGNNIASIVKPGIKPNNENTPQTITYGNRRASIANPGIILPSNRDPIMNTAPYDLKPVNPASGGGNPIQHSSLNNDFLSFYTSQGQSNSYVKPKIMANKQVLEFGSNSFGLNTPNIAVNTTHPDDQALSDYHNNGGLVKGREAVSSLFSQDPIIGFASHLIDSEIAVEYGPDRPSEDQMVRIRQQQQYVPQYGPEKPSYEKMEKLRQQHDRADQKRMQARNRKGLEKHARADRKHMQERYQESLQEDSKSATLTEDPIDQFERHSLKKDVQPDYTMELGQRGGLLQHTVEAESIMDMYNNLNDQGDRNAMLELPEFSEKHSGSINMKTPGFAQDRYDNYNSIDVNNDNENYIF